MQTPLPPLNSPMPAVTTPLIGVQTGDNHQVTAGERMVQGRLGVFGGLFYALRAKHPPTAAHSLRVAIGCSKWACSIAMPAEDRDILEISALLHDVGKIGVPDSILQKPSGLDGQEQLMMEMSRGVAKEMLRGAGACDQIIQIVEQARVANGDQTDLHQSAKMMSIVDAFDSMTTEQVFRRALSRDRAIEELCSHAGTQFAPELVQQYAEIIVRPRPELEADVVTRWLAQFCEDKTPGFNDYATPVSCGAVQNLLDTVYHKRLLDALSDAAIYLDATGQILHWNRAAENMSGRRAASVINLSWNAELLGLSSEQGQPLTPEQCPVERVATTHTKVEQRFEIHRLDGQKLKVQLSAMPVFTGQCEFTGTILLVRDASNQVKLEQRLETLNTIASQDKLTKVANRSALDSRLSAFVREHLQAGRRGSLLICDIDFFKRINDTHGHQAGDDALVTFASILSQAAREDDFVARYGGEEFVVLCGDCDNPTATARAEEMRRSVERTPVPALKNRTMTASFGVTEIQDGDTEATLLARADRALLMAKENGRNRVVQLGAGLTPAPTNTGSSNETAEQKSNWLGWFRAEKALAEREYLASVPREVAIQKLSGFIADHNAEILSADESLVTVRLDGKNCDAVRRQSERTAVLILEVKIQAVQIRSHGRNTTYLKRTKFSVSARPMKSRDRRTAAITGQINQVLHSFKAYLAAQEIDDELRASIIEPR